MLVSVKILERHLDWIGRRYQFAGLDELGERLAAGARGVERMAAVTFDDGYQDFYEHAFPLLRRKGIPAAVFVVTEYAGTARVPLHDRLYLLLARRRGARLEPMPGIRLPDISGMPPYAAMRALVETLSQEALEGVVRRLEAVDSLPEGLLRGWQPLSWETLARLQDAGVTIGSHTRSHTLMTNESAARVREEAAGSRKELEARLGAAVRHFAYPSGRFDAAAVRAVAAAGYEFAYTTCTHRSPEYPLLTIPRTLLWEKSSLNTFGSFSGAVLDCQIQHTFAWVAGCRERHAAGAEAWQ